MAARDEKVKTKELKGLFEEREQLERRFPGLRPSFERFLEDFRAYESMREKVDRHPTVEDYLLYGAHFEESE